MIINDSACFQMKMISLALRHRSLVIVDDGRLKILPSESDDYRRWPFFFSAVILQFHSTI